MTWQGLRDRRPALSQPLPPGRRSTPGGGARCVSEGVAGAGAVSPARRSTREGAEHPGDHGQWRGGRRHKGGPEGSRSEAYGHTSTPPAITDTIA